MVDFARLISLASGALTEHAALIVVSHLLFGAVSMCVLENWTPSEALYFCVVELTTVGYGDLAPKSSLGRLFTALHILLGCTIAASCLGMLVGRMQDAAMQSRRNPAGRSKEIDDLLKATGAAGVIVVVGILYASLVEGWSLIDSFYWAVVSCTSVGFGDLAPSPVVRPIAGIYLLLAVGGFASAAAQVTRTAAAIERQRQVESFAARGVSAELIEQIDTSGVSPAAASCSKCCCASPPPPRVPAAASSPLPPRFLPPRVPAAAIPCRCDSLLPLFHAAPLHAAAVLRRAYSCANSSGSSWLVTATVVNA